MSDICIFNIAKLSIKEESVFMKVIAVTNQKGGIGKTTTATAVVAILASKDYKALLIDADPQCNSTDTYRAQIEGATTLYDVLVEGDTSIEEAIQHTEIGDIVAADPCLEEADTKLEKKGIGGYTRLKEAIDEFRKSGEYDYVVIDTPPAVNHILRNVLIASDEVILPMKVGRYSFQGVNSLAATLDDARKLNPGLKVGGILCVDYDTNTNIGKITQDALSTVSTTLDTKVFDSVIRRCVKVPEAQTFRTTLINYAKSCSAERDYEDFVEEYLGV